MRSGFWLGGSHLSVGVGRLLGRVVAPVARLVRQPSVDDGRELLVRCAQETSHLAGFLLRRHAELVELPSTWQPASGKRSSFYLTGNPRVAPSTPA